MPAHRTHDDYNIGWICALPLEMAAAKLMLDHIHSSLSQPSQDNNSYLLGDINGHNVVVACLPSGVYGTISAAVVASQMLSTYHKIRFGLVVGIGGGVPSPTVDVRLGDIVVSRPTGVLPGVVQYDFGKTIESGKMERTGSLNLPHPALLTALSRLESDHLTETPKFRRYLTDIQAKLRNDEEDGNCKFQYPGQEQDVLYRADYCHPATEADCWSCDWTQAVDRRTRVSHLPQIHYGVIASGNQVMKDGSTRDKLARDLGIICFEMEAAGLMNHFPCVVIRGICDYADSHKNKQWQGYAALAAAAYGKELLSAIPPVTAVAFMPDTPNVGTTEGFTVRFGSINIPPKHFFVGRERELAEIHKGLQSQSAKRTVMLHGLGGIGKTQLALEHTMRHLESYSAVFWFDATDETTLGADFLKMADRISKEPPYSTQLKRIVQNVDTVAAVEWAKKWLSSPGNDRWLIIYDNYEPLPEFTLSSWFPTVRQGHTIITTQVPNLLIGDSIRISRIDNVDHNRKILCERSGRGDLALDPNLTQLAILLDGLPFTLASAGAYLHQTAISCGDLLRLYNEHGLSDSEHGDRIPPFVDERLHCTWMISLQKINEQNRTACLYFLLWGAFGRELWFELVENGNSFFQKSEQRIETDWLSFHAAMKLLCEYGFADIGPLAGEQRHKSRGYSLHGSVHSWILNSVLAKTRPDFSFIAIHCVIKYAAKFHGLNKLHANHRLLPHANHLLRITACGIVPTEDRYGYALMLYELSGIFRTTTVWLSSPILTTCLNVFQIKHPMTSNLAKQEQCYRRVIHLCRGIDEQRFKDLSRDAFHELGNVYVVSGLWERIRTKWLENGACRRASHSDQYLCSRCIHNLYVHIMPTPIYVVLIWLLAWGNILLVLKAGGLQGALWVIYGYFAITAACGTIPRWRHRYKAFTLSVVMMISHQLYGWLVTGHDRIYYHYLVILIGTLPTVALCDHLALRSISMPTSRLSCESQADGPRNRLFHVVLWLSALLGSVFVVVMYGAIFFL